MKSYTPHRVQRPKQAKVTQSLGKNTWWFLGGAFLCVGLAVYVLYIPNLFFIKQVAIDGTSGDVKSRLESSIQEYLAGRASYFVSRANILTLSAASLEHHIREQNPRVHAVVLIKKRLPHGLFIKVEERIDRFALTNPAGAVTVSRDGAITQLGASGNDLLPLKDDRALNLVPGTQLYTGELRTALTAIADTFASKTKLDIERIEIMPVLQESAQIAPDGVRSLTVSPIVEAEPTDLTVYALPKDDAVHAFHALFDTATAEQGIDRLHELLNALPPTQLAKLYYIDLRFKNRGFVCLLDTPCSAPPAPPDQPKPTETPQK